MAWIKWCIGFSLKPEVVQTAAILGMSPYHVAGALMILYEWCDANITEQDNDGNGNAFVTLKTLQKCTIDWVTRTPGLADAMERVGWLHVEDGGWVFPNFYRHNGKSSKERALAAERMSESRGKLRFKRNKNVTTAQPDKIRVDKSIKSMSTYSCEQVPEPPQINIPEEGEPPKAERPHDPIWDTVCEVFGWTDVPKSQRTSVGSVVRDLKTLGATPDEIRIRTVRMRAAWDGKPFSPQAVVKWWTQFAKDPDAAAAELKAADSAKKLEKFNAIFNRKREDDATGK
jgi:hypothetical protein